MSFDMSIAFIFGSKTICEVFAAEPRAFEQICAILQLQVLIAGFVRAINYKRFELRADTSYQLREIESTFARAHVSKAFCLLLRRGNGLLDLLVFWRALKDIKNVPRAFGNLHFDCRVIPVSLKKRLDRFEEFIHQVNSIRPRRKPCFQVTNPV